MVALCRLYQGNRAPKYDFSNIGAAIRRLCARIGELEGAAIRQAAGKSCGVSCLGSREDLRA